MIVLLLEVVDIVDGDEHENELLFELDLPQQVLMVMTEIVRYYALIDY
jgi:hypothetical protein